MPWGPDVETNLAISSANHLKVRFIQQSPFYNNNIFNLSTINYILIVNNCVVSFVTKK
ncbi:hypothetical protein [Arsenophonus endosymbiont of Aphis craccivora]|uniref:hypothetical protein n=1 Tax=Arsenophonus endosymbiont of Aphis craccivora TaxID=1231049 RepID=UPI0015DFB3D1|nr:hypothetical protein [Arsenophonus endosymbiont of Aphis craccivora]